MEKIILKKYEAIYEDKISQITEPEYYKVFKEFSAKQISLIVSDEDVAGWFFLKLPQSSLYSGFIFIYIIPEYRRKGIGTRVYKELQQKFEAIGCNYWSSYPQSKEADEFALSVGFDYVNTNSYLEYSGDFIDVSTEEIRGCRLEDYPTPLDIWSKEYAAMHRRIGIPYTQKELSDSERKEEFDNFCKNISNYFVFENEGKIVGMGSLFDDNSGIGCLAVDNAYSGKGYGTKLAMFLTNECIRRGYTTPCVYCESGNDDAMHIYKKIGYVEKKRESVALKK